MRERIGLAEALELTLSRVPQLEPERVDLARAVGRVLAEDAVGRVTTPDQDVSRKDGYAVVSADLAAASPDNPVTLTVIGNLNAGGRASQPVASGQALRVTTGAPLPPGAQAVLAEEFCDRTGERIRCWATAKPGRNVLFKGADLVAGQVIASAGARLGPARVGLLAAAGLARVSVFTRPRIGLLATGDEIVAPGVALPEGKLYASNLVEMAAWLTDLGMPVDCRVAPDSAAGIRADIQALLPGCDALVTSGGAWTSEKDLLLKVLADLGWQGVYHRVRLGPGKGIGFGLLAGKPVFCLPGGPPSNEMALLQLCLPGLLAMQGSGLPAFRQVPARLDRSVTGQADWTQFIHARLIDDGHGELVVRPAKLPSRLVSMADKQALICIPEGTERLEAGARVRVQLVDRASWL